MTCKDCYHYGVCYFRINSEQTSTEGTKIINCSTFKDKSTIVELPFVVGQKLYTTITGEVLEETVAEIRFDGQTRLNLHPNLGTWVTYKPDIIGKWLFLTRKEAEAALKAMEVDNG